MGDGTDAGTTDPAPSPAPAADKAAPKQPAPAEPKTYSQEQVDDLMAKTRGSTERRFADYEDLRTKASEFDKLADLQKTELQRAQDKASESERKALQLETALAESRLRSDVISIAAGKGIVDPSDAFKLLDRSKVEFDKAGDPTNVGVLLDELLKAKPYLTNRPGNGSGEGGPRGGSKPDEMTANDWFLAKASHNRK